MPLPSPERREEGAVGRDFVNMEEKKQDCFGSDGVDEFFGADVEQEEAQPNTMAERCVLQYANLQLLKLHIAPLPHPSRYTYRVV